MKVYVSYIDWCVDNAEDLDNLPVDAVVDVDDNDDIADALSDEYGFLVNSFVIG